MSLNPQCRGNSVHWLKVERLSGPCLSTVVTPTWSHDPVSLSGCITLTAWHIIGVLSFLADSLARCHGRQYFSTKLSPKRTGGSTVEKPAETQTSIQLASHLVGAPNSRPGGHEFESPMRRELDVLTKSGKTLGVRSFCYIIIFV